MPDPATILKQKEAYVKMLDNQCAAGVSVIDGQFKHQVEYMRAHVDNQKKQLLAQMDLETKHHEVALQQQRTDQLLNLQRGFTHQRTILEQQAQSLIIQYQEKKKEEDMQKHKETMEKRQKELQEKIEKEVQKNGVNVGLHCMGLPLTTLTGTASTINLPTLNDSVLTLPIGGRGGLLGANLQKQKNAQVSVSAANSPAANRAVSGGVAREPSQVEAQAQVVQELHRKFVVRELNQKFKFQTCEEDVSFTQEVRPELVCSPGASVQMRSIKSTI